MIVKHLRQIQEQFGFLPVEELKALSERISEPMHRLNEVVTFFAPFRLTPPLLDEVKVCRDMACHLRGASSCFDTLELVAKKFGVGIPPGSSNDEDERDTNRFRGEPTSSRLKPRVHVEWVSSLGRCDQPPAVMIELHNPGRPDQFRVLGSPSILDHSGRLWEVVGPHLIGDSPPPNLVDDSPLTGQLDPYRSSDDAVRPYEEMRRFAKDWESSADEAGRTTVAEALLKTLSVSGLRGTGGAGVAVARKWSDVREIPGDEKFIICNADVSEPTTFKDREILRHSPHLVIEGIVLAALLTGDQQGYVYIRHEYFDQIHEVEGAIESARAMGIIGTDVLGTNCGFELEVFESPGGYVCGEQLALVEAIEQRRAEPRNKPPQLETNVLHDKPTVVNNVESFSWVSAIALRGGEW